MTPKELSELPLGTIVYIGRDHGEIIQAGQTVHIRWSADTYTSIIDTNSKVWEEFIGDMQK